MDPNQMAIDIHTNKLLDWLISRRHVSSGWVEKLAAIREKMKSAIQDMPEHKEIARLLSGSQLNYYNCVKIVEILRETESSSKNIFGYYSSQRMKDWQEIVRAYEADNIYLAEAAQTLIRNVTYEVPSRKRQEIKCDQARKDCERKVGDFTRQAENHRKEYATESLKLGIKGEDPLKELNELLNELPVLSEVITSKARSEAIVDAAAYYAAFMRYTTRNSYEDLVKMLRYVQEKGNTTYFEYRTGEIPEIVEELKAVSSAAANATAGDDDAIDFGDDGGIDFGDETGSESVNGAFVTVHKTDPNEINFDLDTDGSNKNQSELSSSESGSAGRVARGFDAFRVLEFADTRNELINNLLELEGFLDRRQEEIKMLADETSKHHITMSSIEGAPPEVESVTAERVGEMLAAVTDLLALVTGQKMRNLFLMRDNPKYVEKVVRQLRNRLELADKCELKIRLMHEKSAALAEELAELEQQIPEIIAETKKLQKLIEDDIASKYKGRSVNIMGGVQMLQRSGGNDGLDDDD